uniref:Uncharacterized protein n=1 Tax=Sphaerodactylus townsendi TaxID=933632 RepID=A0ACB8G808_9SAUR
MRVSFSVRPAHPIKFLSLPPPFACRKLEEAHNQFMDEKDQTITQIYRESKEQARSIGLQKQQELLRQKRAEFAQRYRTSHGQFPQATGGLDSVKNPASPSPAAK